MSRARDLADRVLHNRTHEDTEGGRESIVTFKGEQSGGEISTLAQIQASHDGTSDDEKADLIFRTNDGNDGASPTEAMRIDSSGNVGIGTSSPNAPTAIVANTTTYEGLELVTPTGDGSGEFHIGVHDNGGTGGRNIVFKRGGSDGMDTESMRIDDAGKVGIGTSSPDGQLHLFTSDASITPDADADDFIIEANGASGLTIGSSASSVGSIRFADSGSPRAGMIYYDHVGNAMRLYTAATERMRLTQNHALFGMTTNDSQGVQLYTNGANGIWAKCTGTVNYWITRAGQGAGNGSIATIYSDTASVGSITVTSSSTAYSTSSDYRLKENVTDVTDGITRVKQLAPKRFNFIVDADKTVDGFLAHEAQAVVPEAITGTKDEVDDNGDAVMQGIDQSKLVPLLTAALQEAIAKIETLETENTAIKARLDALEAE